MVFKSQLVDVSAVLINVVDNGLVFDEQVELGLESVVLFVEEVNLAVEFANNLLVHFLVVLHA